MGLRRLTGILVIAAALGGCAALAREEARDTERLLVAAGFVQVSLADLPAGILARAIVARSEHGKNIYRYADPVGCHCAYVGGDREYAAYHELAVSNAIAADMSIGAGSANEFAWAAWDPHWAPYDAWADPR
jgi:hypothetical protein